jgi:hypothetical protein
MPAQGEGHQNRLEELLFSGVEAAVSFVGKFEDEPLDATDRLICPHGESPTLAMLP